MALLTFGVTNWGQPTSEQYWAVSLDSALRPRHPSLGQTEVSLAVVTGPLREGPKPPPGEKYTLTSLGFQKSCPKFLNSSGIVTGW